MTGLKQVLALIVVTIPHLCLFLIQLVTSGYHLRNYYEYFEF